jgi:hypothetical protein
MTHILREFFWVLLCVILLSLLPWWQALLGAAFATPFLLRLTEHGFKRRLLFLLCAFLLLLLGLHASATSVTAAVTKLFKLPHYALLASFSAVCFSLVFALAAESVLWIKYSFRRMIRRTEAKA